MMESVHQDLSRFFEWTDQIKTDVIMTDHIDSFDQFNLDLVRTPGKDVVHLAPGRRMTAGASSFDMQTKDWLALQFIYQYSYVFRHGNGHYATLICERLLS